MASILETELAQIIGREMAFLFLDATLTRYVEASSADEADPDAPTTINYPCKAIEENYSAGLLMGGLVRTNEVRVIILATSLAVAPLAGDRITIRGVTRQIVPEGTSGLAGVTSDPARATWMCRAA